MKPFILITTLLIFLSASVPIYFIGEVDFTSAKVIPFIVNPKTHPEARIGIGDNAPEFMLKNIDGNLYSFDNIKDGNGDKPRGFIVIFTCNTCPYAVANEQRIIELHDIYDTKGYPVVAIQPNDPALKPGDSFEAMKKNAQEKEFPFLYLFDEQQEVSPKYGATKNPEVYLVDSNRKIRYHGAIDDSPRDAKQVDEKFVENAIQALEHGKDPNPTLTKAVGCGIKNS